MAAGRVDLNGSDPERVTATLTAALGRVLRERIAELPERGRERSRLDVGRLVLLCAAALFAEDTGLLPPRLVRDALTAAERVGRMDPVLDVLGPGASLLPALGEILPRRGASLSVRQIAALRRVAEEFSFREVRPEVFGSILEQALDPLARHELGVHFTREADIARVVEPTVVAPWRALARAARTADDVARAAARMRAFHVLDPACGSGNFLCVVYREMQRMEADLAALVPGGAPLVPRPWFTPGQLHGIEKSPLVASLARVVLWMGGAAGGAGPDVRRGDALFVGWPRPEGELAVVGNPPYLGVRKMRRELGSAYVDRLFARYPDNRAADYATCWLARAAAVLRPGERGGFVCTNSVAQNRSRAAGIDKILARGGTLTDAWRSYPWPGDAAVHVGIVSWVMGPHDGRVTLDGREVAAITPSLTAAADVTAARKIAANRGLCFMGVTPGTRAFVLTAGERRAILDEDPGSAAVLRPFLIGRDVSREVDQGPTRWIVDFGTMSREEADRFPGAMRWVRERVTIARAGNPRERHLTSYWRFWRPAPSLRQAVGGLARVLVMPCVGPRLLVARKEADLCFDHQLMVVALPDPYAFGVLQSRLHETWAWARGSTLKGDLRYTSSTVFETFPFPLHPDGSYDPRRRPETDAAHEVARAAETFDAQRADACMERGLGLTRIHNLLDAGALPDLACARDALHRAVARCYGLREDAWRDDHEACRELLARNEQAAEQTVAPRPSRPARSPSTAPGVVVSMKA